ncbi:MAG: single-stranded DNA-binding protein [Bacteroidales bacterium]|nr:single-stranded DNA-binding protein [Bacteroidales bacterium]
MEYINHIELAGVVGRVRKQQVADRIVVNFSLVTEEYHKDDSGCAVVETTWHNVVAWQNADMAELDSIERGSHLYVQGRICARRYSDANGDSHILYEVIAASVRLLPND